MAHQNQNQLGSYLLSGGAPTRLASSPARRGRDLPRGARRGRDAQIAVQKMTVAWISLVRGEPFGRRR
jgi:hypothetical protein